MKALLLTFLLLTNGLAQAQTVLNEADTAPVIEAVKVALANQGSLMRSCELTGYMNRNERITINSLLNQARTATIMEGSQPVIILEGLDMKWTDPNYSNNHKVKLKLEITTDSTLTEVTQLVAIILPRLLYTDRVNQGTLTRPVLIDVPRYSSETRYPCL